jgi:hypothetical protein
MAGLEAFLSQALQLLGTVTPELLLIVFLACFLGEAFAIFVPYLLETVWLLSGYHLAAHDITIWQLSLIVFVSLAGRQAGALILYYISKTGSTLFARYFKRWQNRADVSQALPFRLMRKVDTLSPFAVAFARLFWVRIPLTFILGTKGMLRVLMIAVFISSAVYDVLYITLGAVFGASTHLDPLRMLLYSLGAISMLWVFSYGIQCLLKLLKKRKAKDNADTKQAS